MDEHPDGRDVWVKAWGKEHEASLPSPGTPPSPAPPATQKLFKPWYFGGFMKVSSCSHDPLITQYPAALPFPEDRRGAERSKLLIMARSF